MVGASQERLRVVASNLQKQSELNALSVAMAEQRIKDDGSKADAEYRASENKIRNTELNFQEDAGIADRRTRAEEAAQRLRASETERQHEMNIKEINEQRLRDESNARNVQQRLVELEHQQRATTEDRVNLLELKQRELSLREECAYKDRLQTHFKEEERRVCALADSMVAERENKMQIDFDEKYQSQFNAMQAELANEIALLNSERERVKQYWNDITSSKDKDMEILKQRLLETHKALDKVRRPGSSHDVPVHTASATGTVTKVITEISREGSGPKPPNQPGGHGGGGGGYGGNPGDPSDPGRASQPVRDENNKPNPGNPGGPNDPNPPDDPWDAYSAAPRSLRAMVGSTKNSKEAEKIISPALPKARMFRYWKLTVRKTFLSASIDPDTIWLWLLEIEKEGTTFDTLRIQPRGLLPHT